MAGRDAPMRQRFLDARPIAVHPEQCERGRKEHTRRVVASVVNEAEFKVGVRSQGHGVEMKQA